jgi:MFS family permease
LTLIVSARERLNESALFLYFGVAVLCLASRTPDIKHNLNVNNGTYGVLISLGAIGAVIAFMFVGQLTHRFGVGRLLVITGTLTFGSIALIPHIHTAWIFVAVNILLAAGFNSYNIALHHQALKRQLLSGEKNLPRLHGAWSLGTLLSYFSRLPCLACRCTYGNSLVRHNDLDIRYATIFGCGINRIHR